MAWPLASSASPPLSRLSVGAVDRDRCDGETGRLRRRHAVLRTGYVPLPRSHSSTAHVASRPSRRYRRERVPGPYHLQPHGYQMAMETEGGALIDHAAHPNASLDAQVEILVPSGPEAI